MSFRVLDALPALVHRFGETVNKVPDDRNGRLGLENKKVMGFKTGGGKAIGLDVYPANLDCVRLWIEPPAPPPMAGIILLEPKKCADLRRRELSALADAKGIYIEAKSRTAFEALLEWYS
ncbi:hypothetical protein NVS89_14560 [Ancylobacter sp. MQZ15Z-1]|uniref:Uncharacterized protein n=1 Tax=Ancylobacter mangrovi TaxID=2972472 RepID=A0A9X2PF98_9HYPH|nr:hypothetical protein [Ancylobacter mangrovi]MCS0496324.1 hypothetical protein [Ancylobacter mangrovi]